MIQKYNSSSEIKIGSLLAEYNKLLKHLFSQPKKLDNLRVLFTKFQKDKDILDKPSGLRSFIRQLYSVNQNYFTIIPLLFLQYFKKELLDNEKSLIDIDKFITKKIECFGDKFVRKQITQIKQEENLKLDLGDLKKKLDLFAEIGYIQNLDVLLDKINKISNQAQKSFKQFEKFTHSICQRNHGINFKANKKLPDGSCKIKYFRNFMRVIEKIFQKQFVDSQKQNFLSEVQKKIKQNKIYQHHKIGQLMINIWIQKIQKLLTDKKNKKISIQCYISDFIRGCCFFKTKKELIHAAQEIIKQCAQQKYEVIDVAERIGRGTHQIIFKIHFKNTVAEFQLIRIRQSMEIDEQNREYIHQLYQIRRSVMGSIFGSYLYFCKFNDILFYEMQRQKIQEEVKKQI